MEGAEKSDKASPPLQIDPKCLQDALRSFFQPIKTGDPRVDFYTMYKREATEYDTDYVKKYDEDLNTTLIFAGLFSAVSSAFVIDVHSNLQPDPNEQSAALLRAILLTLNQSAIPGETPAVPPVQEGPLSETVIVTSLMYASLIISMLAAFVAMLGKQWLNRYLRNSGGSMIERCGDRQRKCDGLEKWPFHSFVESLPLMLQVSLLLLACGLCRHMWTINTPVACTLISITGLGVVFYIGIVIAGMSSYACPFQTPASVALRGPWKKVRPEIVPYIVHFKRVLSWTHRTWKQKVQPGLDSLIVHSERALSRIRRMWKWRVRPLLRRPPLPTMVSFGDVQMDLPIQESEPWLRPQDLAIIRRTNTDDALCVSWILRSITDPEAIDAALPLAGEIRWFDDGVNVNPPYDMIVSTFEACFDSTRRLYPGSRDRAYYSGRAILWIHTLAMCKSEDFALTFPLPDADYTTPVPDPDLEHLLRVNSEDSDLGEHIASILSTKPGWTPSHSQWISNLLLHFSCTNLIELHGGTILDEIPNIEHDNKTTISLNTALNLVLVWCAFFGSPVEEEALMVQDKSYRTVSILNRLSNVDLLESIRTSLPRNFTYTMLSNLAKLETTPERLTEIAYKWCSVICENCRNLSKWQGDLFVCLQIGFRRLDFRRQSINLTITHTEHHRRLIDVVFESQETEVIADLLHAWTIGSNPHTLVAPPLGSCVWRLINLQNQLPSSPRFRRLSIRSVELTGYEGFEGVAVERFIEFLNHLHVTTEDIDSESSWVELLLGTIRSSEAPQHLSHSYWELLAEHTVSSQSPIVNFADGLQITTSLIEAKEWSKLECWMGIFWMLLPEDADPTEGDLGHSMTLLFRQRPGAIQKLEQWVKRWGRNNRNRVPNSFQQLCKQAHEAAKQDASPSPMDHRPSISNRLEETDSGSHRTPNN